MLRAGRKMLVSDYLTERDSFLRYSSDERIWKFSEKFSLGGV
jgi:hypothetical protein